MNRSLILFAIVALWATLIPATAFAASNDSANRRDFALRINGDYTVRPGESIGTLVVIRGNAAVEGTVRDALVVIDGRADVNGGTVDGDITVISGDASLASGSRVHNLTLIRSGLRQDPGATITGSVERRSRLFFPGAALLLGILFWIGATVLSLLAGLAFAAVGGRQLESAAASLTAAPGHTVLGGLAVVIGLPIVAVLAIVTVIGIPAGLGLLIFVLPTCVLLGHLVAGTWLGMLILHRAPRPDGSAHPYLEAVLGIGILQAALLVPGIGFLAVGLIGLWGTGGIAYLAWRAFRGSPPPAVALPPAAGVPPAAPA